MRRRWLAVAALAFALLGPSSDGRAAEATLATARHLYETGAYTAAADIASGLDSAEGLTLAARAVLAFAATEAAAEAKRPAFERAEALARAATERDPNLAEAYRLRVVALGHIARSQSPISAFLDGYAGDARTLIDRALALEPHSPWVHVVLGAWHAEIVAVAGADLAEALYGASVDKALAAFDRAIGLDPGNPVLRFEYAGALVRLNGLAVDARVENQLSVAARARPGSAFEAATVAKAERARRAIERGDPETAVRLLVPDAPSGGASAAH